MARGKKRRPKPLTFTLTPAQLKDLKKRGLLNKKTGEVKVTFRAGKLRVVKHKKGRSFVASNAAFA